jgi:hypothetical protein
MKKSNLNSICKERELQRLRRMTPEQRLKAQARLNVRIRELFFAGLRSQGFSGSEIARLWRGK